MKGRIVAVAFVWAIVMAVVMVPEPTFGAASDPCVSPSVFYGDQLGSCPPLSTQSPWYINYGCTHMAIYPTTQGIEPPHYVASGCSGSQTERLVLY